MRYHILINTLCHLNQCLQCHSSKQRNPQYSAVWGQSFIHRSTQHGWWGSSCLLCSEVIPVLDQPCAGPCFCRCCGWCHIMCGSFLRGVSPSEDCTALPVSPVSTLTKLELNSRGRNQFFFISLFEFFFSLECVQGRMGDRPFYLSGFVSFHGTSYPALP